MRTKAKRCISCNQVIPSQRLKALPNTTRCVNCSTAQPKGGISITRGEGDHTYTETIIMEHDEYVEYKKIEAKFKNKPFGDFSEINLGTSDDSTPQEDTDFSDLEIDPEAEE